MKRTVYILSAIMLSCMAIQSVYAQSKLNLQSKAMLQDLKKEQMLRKSIKADDDAKQPTRIAAFVRIADQEVVPQLEALGVEVMANLNTIITCSLPVDKIDEISALESVQSISFGEKVSLHNDRARSVSHVNEVHAMVDRQGLKYTGKGVIYGTVDQAFDFQHAAFKDENGASRILCVYQADEENLFPGGEKYGNYPGKLYSGAEINSLTTDLDKDMHGAHTMATGAGGRYFSDTYYGMAPEADIMASSFYHTSTNIEMINGAKVLVDKAKELGKPIAINMSIGREIGPHDGTSDMATALDALAGPGVIIALSSGNDGDRKLHLHKPAGKKVMSLLYDNTVIDFGIYGRIKIDAWSRDNEHSFKMQMAIVDKTTGKIVTTSPVIEADGRRDAQMTEYTDPKYISDDAKMMLGADYSPFTGRREAVVMLKDNLFLDDVKQSLAIILEGDAEVDVYMSESEFTANNIPEPYIEGDAMQSFSDYATGKNTICVGSYVTRLDWTNVDGDHKEMEGTIGDYAKSSSYGISNDGRSFPTISAPGEYLISALSQWYTKEHDMHNIKTDKPGYGIAACSGTSMACPVVTGTIALWLQADPTLDVNDIRDIMSHTAAQDEFTEATPIRFGYGKIDAKAGLEYILNKQAVGVTSVYNDEKKPAKMLDKQHKRIVISKDGQLYSVQGTRL